MLDTPPPIDQGERPLVNIVGERVALGPLHTELLPLLVRWENDFATVDRGGDEPRPRSPEAAAAFWEPLFRGERPDWIGFAIYERPDLRPIGVANLRDYVTPHRTAEFGITIGETDRRGRGLGTEATQLVLDYTFGVLGVPNVWLDTLADNTPALRAYARAGFEEIGRRRQAHRRGDRVTDVVLMDCLATEFVPPPYPRLAPLLTRRGEPRRRLREAVRPTRAGVAWRRYRASPATRSVRHNAPERGFPARHTENERDGPVDLFQ